ncbi:MAG: ABC transporter ATP-binding protein [Thiomonas sp.]|uniref:ABC transporter ATP-binding protein n=1 Tax=Thiomonas sp. TaxID=2047785 RepID=UPI002A3650EA|nr:ABC transporter ATP-binding protein [Thiomonas sp.]MDY0329897.1 ABC transporter ATP-binding protein [Thiomonas sp.]
MKTDAWLQVEALDVVAAAHQPALARKLSLRLLPGDRLGVIGRNGTGKSTLLRQLAGLLPLAGQSAAVSLAGQSLRELAPEKLAVLRTLMPAQPRDRFNLSALALLELSQPEPDLPAAMEALRRVDAWVLRDRPVLALSAGERQRVALAQALVQNASLLLLDEPVAFQDPGHQSLVGDLLAGLTERVVVFCAHDVNWVARFGTHVLGLGSKENAQGWFFDTCEAALEPERLQHLYGCRWTHLRDASGHRAWMAL